MSKKGRPSKYKGTSTPIVRKLAEAFQNDLNVEEASTYAGISKDTYYRWLAENKEFSDEVEAAQACIFITAKKVIYQAVAKGDLRMAQWVLERRQRKIY